MKESFIRLELNLQMLSYRCWSLKRNVSCQSCWCVLNPRCRQEQGTCTNRTEGAETRATCTESQGRGDTTRRLKDDESYKHQPQVKTHTCGKDCEAQVQCLERITRTTGQVRQDKHTDPVQTQTFTQAADRK